LPELIFTHPVSKIKKALSFFYFGWKSVLRGDYACLGVMCIYETQVRGDAVYMTIGEISFKLRNMLTV
jgi:hypothetical protein